jgi:formate dehydrogenase (coenzyme F420) beta subunit
MKDKVKAWLEEGIVDVFLGYKNVDGHCLPYCFILERLEDLDDFTEGTARYPLEKIAAHIAAKNPDIKIGMPIRECNRRSLNVLYIWNQLRPEQVSTLDVNCCPSMLRDHADCSYLEPRSIGACKKQVGVDNNLRVEDLDDYGSGEGLDRWMYEFQKCIKCYGCRNICPVCFCRECSLEHDELVGAGPLIPDIPVFHLVRAVHMAGRCVDCGLCEDACPMDIPLRLLYRKVNKIMIDLFGYSAGTSAGQPPFSMLGDKVLMEPKPIQPVKGEAS